MNMKSKMTESAIEHFRGINEKMKVNCAQAIALAFKEKFSIKDETIQEQKKNGGGKAPDGNCGALHSALEILGKQYPDKAEELKCYFSKTAGSCECSEIKKIKKLTCVQCVELTAIYLEEI